MGWTSAAALAARRVRARAAVSERLPRSLTLRSKKKRGKNRLGFMAETSKLFRM